MENNDQISFIYAYVNYLTKKMHNDNQINA